MEVSQKTERWQATDICICSSPGVLCIEHTDLFETREIMADVCAYHYIPYHPDYKKNHHAEVKIRLHVHEMLKTVHHSMYRFRSISGLRFLQQLR